jgi:hypothetical protein
MTKTDREVLELCKSWFEDIMERCDRLTSGNVSHGSRTIHGIAKNYAEFVDEHLQNRWKPSNEHYELEEVDIEKELNDYGYHYDYVSLADRKELVDFAKHFFELGLKAQKGE